jgi:hypothetical protein
VFPWSASVAVKVALRAGAAVICRLRVTPAAGAECSLSTRPTPGVYALREAVWTARLHLWVEAEFNPGSTCAPMTGPVGWNDRVGMTFTDYLINAVFVLVVLRQARERRLDVRSFVAPMALVVFVATHYVHTIPTGGQDLDLVGALTALGVGLGLLCGFTTHVRTDEDGTRFARVGWLAGGFLVAGISARVLFVFALHHGAGPAVRAFSISHHIDAAAWPLALVSMALCEVTVRLVVVQLRGRRIPAWQRAGLAGV